jgi:hypothetical protein
MIRTTKQRTANLLQPDTDVLLNGKQKQKKDVSKVSFSKEPYPQVTFVSRVRSLRESGSGPAHHITASPPFRRVLSCFLLSVLLNDMISVIRGKIEIQDFG